METEEAGNGLYIVAADKDSKLGLSARIHGLQNAACVFVVRIEQRLTFKVQVNTWSFWRGW
jgi:hypothetical protein